MNDKQNKWNKQYYSNLGVKEMFRFSCSNGLWVLLGIVLGDIFQSKLIFLVFVLLLLIFSLPSLVWRPAYLIHRKILGNPNLPTEPIPLRRRKTLHPASPPIPWIYQLPVILVSIVKLLISFLLMYFIIKYLLLA